MTTIDFNINDNVSYLDKITSRFLSTLNGYKDSKMIIKNISSLFLFKIGILKHIKIKLKNKKIIEIKNDKDYKKFWDLKGIVELMKTDGLFIRHDKNSVSFKYKNYKLKFLINKLNLSEMLYALREEFCIEQYKNLDVKNAIVLDIGAYVADSAIYFATHGSKIVYAYEPYPNSYLIGKRNIELNGFTNKIKLMNSAIGNESGKIRIDKSFKSNMGNDLVDFKVGKKIKIINIRDIIKKYNINNGVLKIDCEGCEYGIILNLEKEYLRKFKQIIIEYHYGYKNLKKYLKSAGFSVYVGKPIHYFDPSKSVNKSGYVGFIEARRL